MAWLSALFGFFAPFLPEVIKLIGKKQDYKQELEMMRLRGEMASQEHTWRMAEIESKADIEESKVIRQDHRSFGVDLLDAAAKTGWSARLVVPGYYLFVLLDFINGIIRPGITTALVAFYMAVKFGQYQILIGQKVVADQAIVQIWSENDYAMLALVLSFWFGQRAAKYAFKWK